MSNKKADEQYFESVLNIYQIGLELSMRGSDIISNCDHLLYFKCHKINFKWKGSYIDSSEWIKTHKSDNKSHQKR